MIIDFENFGQWQKRERKKQHISQELLAERVGVSTQSIWTYENAKKSPTVFTMICIAECLGYDLNLSITERQSNILSA